MQKSFAVVKTPSESGQAMNINLLSSKYKVKKIDENDIQQVLKLCLQNPLYYKHCPPNATIENINEGLKALPPNKTYEDKYYIGFFEDEKLVAVMDLICKYPDDETAFLGFFMMSSEYQKKGIGTFIISDCINYLKSIQYKKVRLGYVKENNQARNFWQKNGFLPTGIEKAQELYTIVVMEKAL